MTFRPAKLSDLPWAFELHKLALKPYVEQIWGWDEAWQRDNFEKVLDIPNAQIILLNGVPIGRLNVVEKPDHLYLSHIALLPKYRNRGLGAQVIRLVVARATTQNLPLKLNVLRPNPVKALYERLGFVVVKGDDIRFEMVYKPDE